MFIPNTVRPSLQHKEHLQGLFCASNILETASPQLTIYLNVTKNVVENVVQCLYRLKSFSLIALHTVSLPRIFGYWSLAWHPTAHMVCTQGNHLMTINNDASITTCSLPEQKEPLGRLHAALHIALKQQQTPQTHSSQITEKQTS